MLTNNDSERVLEIALALHKNHAVGPLTTALLDIIDRELNAEVALVLNESFGSLTICGGYGVSEAAMSVQFMTESPLADALKTEQPVNAGSPNAGLLQDMKIETAQGMVHNGNLVGAIAIQPAPKTDQDIATLKMITQLAASAYAVSTELQTAGNERLDEIQERADRVLDAARSFSSATNTGGLLRRILAESIQAVNAHKGSLMLLDESGMLAVRVVFGLPDKLIENKINNGEIPCARFAPGQGVAGSVYSSCRPQRINQVKENADFTNAQNTYANSILCVPIPTDDDVLGVINITNCKSGEFTEKDETTLVELAAQAGAAIERAVAMDSLLRDELTDLYLGPFVEKRLDEELVRSARYKTEVCLIAATIDQIHNIREDFGDDVADAIIAEAAAILDDQLRRQIDMVGHFGEGWFEILLPQTPLDGGLVVANRLQEAIDELELKDGEGSALPITLSVAVGTFSGNDDSRSAIREMDRTLAEALEDGERVSVALGKS